MSLLADLALKGTLVLLAALAASHLLRRDSAATRHLVWAATLPNSGPNGGFFRDREPVAW